jgi:hypothetical protein
MAEQDRFDAIIEFRGEDAVSIETYSSGMRCVINAFGLSTPLCTCAIKRGNSRFTEAWFARIVRPLFTTLPIGMSVIDWAVNADDRDDARPF